MGRPRSFKQGFCARRTKLKPCFSPLLPHRRGSGVFRRLTEENVSIRCFLYEMAAERFSEVLWIMQQILFMGFDRRLALFLLEAGRREGPQLRLTHEQIARDLGSAREVVTRMLRRFSQEGLVELGRGSVTVKDPEGLRRLAGA